MNDRVLKVAWPSWWGGKLSDVFGTFLLPFLLLSCAEILCSAITRRRLCLAWSALAAALLVTAAGLVLTKCVVAVGLAYGDVIGALRMPVKWACGLGGSTPARFEPTTVVHDPTDTVALVSLLPAFLAGAKIIGRRRAGDSAAQPLEPRRRIAGSSIHGAAPRTKALPRGDQPGRARERPCRVPDRSNLGGISPTGLLRVRQ